MNNITENKEKTIKNIDNNNNQYKIIEQNILELNPKEKEKIMSYKNKNEVNGDKIYKIQNKNEIQNETQINLKENEENPQKTEYTKKIGNYILFDQIGMGTFSKVTKAIHLITSQQVAVKILDKEKIEDEVDLERIIREIEILKNIHHPNIAQMYETYSTIHNFYLMMELVSGGDLFDYITENSYLSENLSCQFFRQLIGVLEYLISMGIAHRDIKPENILLDENHKNIKVIDFGLSNYFEDNELLCSSCGSPCYASPEMLSGKPYQGIKTDIWSGGIVLYSMLVGSLPFDDQELCILYEQIKKGKFYLPSTLSLEAIDLLKRILQVDPNKRIGIEEIKKHPWFNMEKNPIYKGINISKEKFPCNREVVQFILDNFFKNENDINCDDIIEMVETHACNKYTSTYYLTKMNILGIEDEFLIMNSDKIDEKNNNLFIENNNLKNDKIECNTNIKNRSKSKNKERKIHKSRTKNYFNNNYNKIKINILGLLNDEDEDENDKNEDEGEQPFQNLHLNFNENYNINKNEKRNIIVINNNVNKEKEKDNNDNIIIKNQNKKIKKKDSNNVKIKNQVNQNKKKTIKYSNNNKKETISKQKNKKKIVYVNKNRNKLNTVNVLSESNNIYSFNSHKLKNNTISDRNNFNSLNYINSNEKKLVIKTNNNSHNKSLNDKNNKNVRTINKKATDKNICLNQNKSKNNNILSERYKSKKVTYIKKNNTPNILNEIKNHLIQMKTPPRKNSNYNFYILNNNKNKDKKYEHTKFCTLNYDNKAIITEPNEINTFIVKKLHNLKINKNANKDNNNKIMNKNVKKQKYNENNKYYIKTKNEYMLDPFSLKAQLIMGKKAKIKEGINKSNKIRVNLKPNNNDLHYDKSPAKTIEIKLHKKGLKFIPKLRLDNINNKFRDANPKKSLREDSIPSNKSLLNNIVNNYSFYSHNKRNTISNRCDSNSKYNLNKNNKINKRKTNKNNCLLNKKYITQVKQNISLNEDNKKYYHQRNVSSGKSELSNIKIKNNLTMNANKIYFILKDHIIPNKKNKVLKRNNLISINNSYMNEYYSQNFKKRKNLTNSEDNNVNSYIHKPIKNNNLDKKTNRKIVKKSSYLCTNIKYKINNHDKNIINNMTNLTKNNSKLNNPIKKEYYINTNNQNVININMVLHQNKYKNRNINNNFISTDSMNDTPINLNTDQEFDQSPYFTENFSDNNISDDKPKNNILNYGISQKKNK